MAINSALAKVLLLPTLLFWAFGASVWLSSLSTTARSGCRQLFARSLRIPFGDDQFPSNATIPSPSPEPAERTLGSKKADFDQVMKHYWLKIDEPRHDRTMLNCTLVMQTYKRDKILPRVLNHYCKIPLLQRIVVVWNDIDTAVSKSLLNLTRGCAAELMFVVSRENKLTNRYIPRKEIETDCKWLPCGLCGKLLCGCFLHLVSVWILGAYGQWASRLFST